MFLTVPVGIIIVDINDPSIIFADVEIIVDGLSHHTMTIITV